MDIVEKTSKYLGENIENLRSLKNMSQLQLAQQAEIPRSTLTNIESGVANPSLKNLIKISLALGVSIEELLSKPRTDCLLIKSNEVPVLIRGQGRVRLHKLLPEKIKGIEIDKLELSAEAVMGGHPHLDGTKEYLTVLQGEVSVHVAGETFNVKAGDVFAFSGNQPHSYRNLRKTTSIGISVVIPMPVFL
ncbi:MAG: helix-turn-helix domain-containing protein [Bdellovibrionales bacterium]|nr:helix-turn-helix domain-containing protein [Bdellovibrionales bacterium]